MNEKEKWLNERINGNPILDENERWFIDLLRNNSVHDNDVSSAIDNLAMLLSLDALVPLLDFIKSNQRNISLREQAAKAISEIGSVYIETELRKLLDSPVPELKLLSQIALEKSL